MHTSEPDLDFNLDRILDISLKACRKGREVLLNYFGRLENVEEKHQAGLVSEADRESELAIFSYLKSVMPDSDFLGEESSYLNHIPNSSMNRKGPRWILDPLDGTTNYVHKFPIYCISLAFELNSEVQVGVIDVPALGETYTAIKGRGSHVNGKPLKVTQAKTLKETLLSTGFFGENEEQLQRQLKIFTQIVRNCHGVRRPGAAAFDLCMVARGVFDGFWEEGLKSWDLAAGSLIVSEAGGIVKNFRNCDSKVFSIYNDSIVAASPGIIMELEEIIVSNL